MSREVRPAGRLERFHITRHLLGFDSCVISAAQYRSTDLRSLTKDVLFPAVRKVVETHAALGVRLVGESTGNPWFARLENIDLSVVIDFSESNDLETVFEAQLSRPFDTKSDTPLWRVVVLKNNYVCFAWHHCIGDGLSGLAFHRTLLAALEDTTDYRNVDTTSVTVPSTTVFLPSIESVTNLSPSWKKVFREVYDLFAPTSWTRGASAWTGNIVGTDITLKTNVRFIDFTPEEVNEFLVLCRLNETTLTSAYQMLATSVLSSLISERKSKAKTISSYVPVSLREVAGSSQDSFCDYVTTLHTYPPIKTTFSWADASRFSANLRSAAERNKEEIGMLKYLFGRYELYFRAKIGQKRQGGLEISNLGRFNVGTRAEHVKWTIERTTFAQCDVIVGAALKLSCVGDPRGGVSIAVTWGEGFMDSQVELFVSKFTNDFKKLLGSNGDLGR